MTEFSRINRLPPYVFSIMDKLKQEYVDRGENIYDFGMGNPDQATPSHIVDVLREISLKGEAHRYSASKGIVGLREAVCRWYKRRYDVDLNPETEAIATIGSKEGLSHLALAMVDHGDTILVPNPCYPVHRYGFVIAGAEAISLSFTNSDEFLVLLDKTLHETNPKPKAIILNFPCNPTTECVELSFFTEVIRIAKKYNVWVIQDLAYADIVFDGYVAPSILQVPGAKDIAVEAYTMSKSYNMAGWRVGFMCGNATLVGALTRIKSYLDYGSFTPIQVAAIAALDGSDECVKKISDTYQGRRDVLCKGLNEMGWHVTPPKATMFVWIRIPEKFQKLGSLDFAKLLFENTKVVVSPGLGFGEWGDAFVRFSLIENEARCSEALVAIKKFFQGE